MKLYNNPSCAQSPCGFRYYTVPYPCLSVHSPSFVCSFARLLSRKLILPSQYTPYTGYTHIQRRQSRLVLLSASSVKFAYVERLQKLNLGFLWLMLQSCSKLHLGLHFQDWCASFLRWFHLGRYSLPSPPSLLALGEKFWEVRRIRTNLSNV